MFDPSRKFQLLIAAAAIGKAAAGGRRFGIAATTPGLVRAIEARVRDLGFAGSFTGLQLAAADALALTADPCASEAALVAAVRRCIAEDGAEVVVIGGGPLSEMAARRRCGDAVVEPVPAAFCAVAGLPRVPTRSGIARKIVVEGPS